MPLIAIRRGPFLYTPEKALPRGTETGSPAVRRLAPGTGFAASEGDSARGSTCDGSACLRFTSLRPPPAAAAPVTRCPFVRCSAAVVAWTAPRVPCFAAAGPASCL